MTNKYKEAILTKYKNNLNFSLEKNANLLLKSFFNNSFFRIKGGSYFQKYFSTIMIFIRNAFISRAVISPTREQQQEMQLDVGSAPY